MKGARKGLSCVSYSAAPLKSAEIVSSAFYRAVRQASLAAFKVLFTTLKKQTQEIERRDYEFAAVFLLKKKKDYTGMTCVA